MLDIASEYLLRLELYTDISDAADPVPAQFCITLQKKKKIRMSRLQNIGKTTGPCQREHYTPVGTPFDEYYLVAGAECPLFKQNMWMLLHTI